VKRPPWEVADIIRRAGNKFIERYRDSLTWAQLKVLRAIECCRTAALGGHRDQCARCGYQAISYNSCRNRHCPKCQTNAREKWLRAREQELLPVCYFHLVFSVPHALVPLIWQNKKILFSLLFQTSAATLLEVAADPARLGSEIGFLSILHTWGQTLQRHPHLHCVVPGGGLSPDHARWIRAPCHFFLPVRVLSRVFRGKFVAGLRQAFHRNQLGFYGECQQLASEKAFAAFLRTLFRQEWVVYSKRPFGGPRHVLQYLARYTHRVAISNHRIADVNDTHVAFRWKDYAHHSKLRTMSLIHEEFLRRFLQHVLPKAFPRIRYFGFLANRRRGDLLPVCRALLSAPPPADTTAPTANESVVWQCPKCQGQMHVVERLTAQQIRREEHRRVCFLDTS
jgi:putative transposase/transposase-like zinc-binding protein